MARDQLLLYKRVKVLWGKKNKTKLYKLDDRIPQTTLSFPEGMLVTSLFGALWLLLGQHFLTWGECQNQRGSFFKIFFVCGPSPEPLELESLGVEVWMCAFEPHR